MRITSLLLTLLSFSFGLVSSVSISYLARPDYGPIAEASNIELLTAQAQGHKAYWGTYDRPRGMVDGLTVRHFWSEHSRAAIRRLAELGPDARDAVPSLIEILQKGRNDFDTGDEVLPDRSSVAIALGMIGDTRAIPALIEKLRVSEPHARNYWVSQPEGSDVTVGVGHEAIACALGMFGANAADALPLLHSIRRERRSVAANSRGLAQAIRAISTDSPPDYPAYRAW